MSPLTLSSGHSFPSPALLLMVGSMLTNPWEGRSVQSFTFEAADLASAPAFHLQITWLRPTRLHGHTSPAVTQEMQGLLGIDQDPSAHSIALPRLRAAAAHSGSSAHLHQHHGNFRWGPPAAGMRVCTGIQQSSAGCQRLLPVHMGSHAALCFRLVPRQTYGCCYTSCSRGWVLSSQITEAVADTLGAGCGVDGILLDVGLSSMQVRGTCSGSVTASQMLACLLASLLAR